MGTQKAAKGRQSSGIGCPTSASESAAEDPIWNAFSPAHFDVDTELQDWSVWVKLLSAGLPDLISSSTDGESCEYSDYT